MDEPEDLEYVRRVWALLDALGPGPHDYENVMKAAATAGDGRCHQVSNAGLFRSLFEAARGVKAAPLSLTQSEEWLRRKRGDRP